MTNLAHPILRVIDCTGVSRNRRNHHVPVDRDSSEPRNEPNDSVQRTIPARIAAVARWSRGKRCCRRKEQYQQERRNH